MEGLGAVDAAHAKPATPIGAVRGVDVRRIEVQVTGVGTRGVRSSRPVVPVRASIAERTAVVEASEEEVVRISL